MNIEQELYDKFVNVLNNRLDDEDISAKDLEIVMKFLANNGIQASMNHKGLNSLTNKATELPFDDEDNVLPLRKLQ